MKQSRSYLPLKLTTKLPQDLTGSLELHLHLLLPRLQLLLLLLEETWVLLLLHKGILSGSSRPRKLPNRRLMKLSRSYLLSRLNTKQPQDLTGSLEQLLLLLRLLLLLLRPQEPGETSGPRL